MKGFTQDEIRMDSFGMVLETLNSGTRSECREAIARLHREMMALPQVEQPLVHNFCPGLYLRRIINPAGSLVMTKIHKEPNISTLLRGRMAVITEDGAQILVAPAQFITQPGTKRVIYAIEECEFTTIHPNPLNVTDLDALEDRIIARDFDEIVPTLEAV